MDPHPPRRERASKAQRPQSAEAFSNPDALLNFKTVVMYTGLSESTIKRKMKDGTFPMCHYVKAASRNLRRWRAGEITKWLKDNGITAAKAND